MKYILIICLVLFVIGLLKVALSVKVTDNTKAQK